MDALTNDSVIFENSINSINVDFIDAIALFTESCQVTYIVTEKSKETLYEAIKRFFSDIIGAFQEFCANVSLDVEEKLRKNDTKRRLDDMHKQLRGLSKDKIPYVQVVDVWSLKEEYLKAVNDLSEIGKKISGMKYKNTTEIDEDLALFNKKVNEYDTILTESIEKKIKVKTDVMLCFVEDEVSGRSKVITSLNDAISLFKRMQKDAELLEKRRDRLGADVIPKYTGVVRRVTLAISNFFKKWVVRIITTFCLII